MRYKIEYTNEAADDMRSLNKSQQIPIRAAIAKVAENPLPRSDGGYGEPLGNKRGKNLTGLCKIKLLKLGIRVVYRVIRESAIMKIIVIAARADYEVYDMAYERTK
ncbi:MAG: type II toxin-antitoxin system RelE/ParE family toxin [Oscillospiraceae bacterium]|jgi:mRNA interferase RelE/StbE|nr:type II toxin-antitoxin system RelE/ParE family toxin [Oscillospiraceae bacterium]